jgi:hypothetical protein
MMDDFSAWYMDALLLRPRTLEEWIASAFVYVFSFPPAKYMRASGLALKAYT